MKIFLTFLVALITFQGYAQSERSFEVESFQVCVRAVYSFMLDYEAANGLTEAEKKGKALTEKFLEEFNDRDTISFKQDAFKEILMDNGWGENGINLFQKLLDEKNKEIESGKDILIMLENSKSLARANNEAGQNIISYENWNSLVKEFEGVEKNRLEEDQNTQTSIEEPIQKVVETKNEPLNILTWLGFIALAFTGGIMIGFLLAKARFNNEIETAKNTPLIKKKLRKIESEKEKLLRRISQLEHEKSESERRNVVFKIEKPKSIDPIIESKTSSVSPQETISDKDTLEAQIQEPVQHSNSVYFQYPERDGFFKKEFASSTKQRDSYFEIVFRDNLPEGELKFIADRNSYSKILALRDTSLSPVSEIENPGNVDKPTSITLIENGIVEIKEDRFTIKEGNKLKMRIS